MGGRVEGGCMLHLTLSVNSVFNMINEYVGFGQ